MYIECTFLFSLSNILLQITRCWLCTIVIYSLLIPGQHNNYTHEFGIGTYHSGVQVGGREYTFSGGSGVFFHDPKDVPGDATFRER
mgnify:CR=1 FL=1